MLSVFVGIEVIGNVPTVLHTPLMSGANAIHGVVVVGAIIVVLDANPTDYLSLALGFIAVVLGTLNVVGGFIVPKIANVIPTAAMVLPCRAVFALPIFFNPTIKVIEAIM